MFFFVLIQKRTKKNQGKPIPIAIGTARFAGQRHVTSMLFLKPI
jgi:hypothetical protein